MRPHSRGERLESALPNAKTQRDRILGLLIEARGEWVPLPTILGLGVAQYNARIFELRRLGFNVENRSEADPETGARHSWFRLANSPIRQDSQKGKPLSEFMRRRQREVATALPLFTQDLA